MAAEVAHIAIVVLFLGPIRRALVPPFSQDTSSFSGVKFTIYVVILSFNSLLLTPLEVAATRLAIQRNHAATEDNSVSQEELPAGVGEYPNADEDVIGCVFLHLYRCYFNVVSSLRQEDDPYLGLGDCVKRIIDEEGWTTLYRAWWLTLIGGLMSAIA